MFDFSLIIYLIIMIPYAVHYIRKNRFTPVSVFLIMQMLFFLGICFYNGGKDDVKTKLEWIYVCASVFFIIGVFLASTITNRHLSTSKGSFEDTTMNSTQMMIINFIIIVSVVLCTWFLFIRGRNVFLQSLKDLFSGGIGDYRDLRKDFRSVGGVGYIYQFRVILLPILASYIAFCGKEPTNKLARILLYVFMIFCILGTGQRNAFVFYSAIMVVYIFAMKSMYRITILPIKTIIFFGMLAVGGLLILTVSNGRVGASDNIFMGAIDSLVNRFLQVNQESAIYAFHYIDTQPICWGRDWWEMLKQILPGKTDYLPVDNIAYYMMYGNYEGTNPPDIWGSAFYNFGILGCTVFPTVMGFLYHRVYQNMRAYSKKNRMYMLLYTALCVYLGIWSYGTPMTLINNGVLTVLLLRWLLFTFSKQINSIRSRQYD